MKPRVFGLIAVFCFGLAASSAAQAPNSDQELQQALMASERQLWEGWKQGDSAAFQKNLGRGAWTVGSQGTEERDQVLKSIAKRECMVTSYSFDDSSVKLRKLNEMTAVLNYTSRQDATCAGQKVPNEVYATAIYVRQDGQWKNMFYTESPSASALKAMSTH